MDTTKGFFLIVGVLVAGLLFGAVFTGQAVKKGCKDRDGDGYFFQSACGTSVDCNDANPSIYPGAPEICQDGIDQNCDGVDQACTTISTSVSSTIPNCVDSDGGQDVFIKGSVTTNTTLYWDFCVASNTTAFTVNEYYCNSFGLPANVRINCPSSYVCNDGACRLT